jgi:plasmid segregation protein ParM
MFEPRRGRNAKVGLKWGGFLIGDRSPAAVSFIPFATSVAMHSKRREEMSIGDRQSQSRGNNHPFVLAADFGFGQVKLAWGGNGVDYTELVKPSTVIRTSEAGVLQGVQGISASAGVHVEVDGQRWLAWVDPNAFQRSRIERDEGTHRSSEYMALFHASLRACGASSIDTLVVGLPVNLATDAVVVSELQSRFSGSHEVCVDSGAAKRTITVRDVKVLAQPMGAFLEVYARAKKAEDGLTQEDLGKRNILVYDPGYFSFDFCTIRRGMAAVRESGTSTDAMRAVIEAAKRRISQSLGAKVDVEQINDALRQIGRAPHGSAATVLVQGRELDVRAELLDAVAEVADRAVRDMRSKFNVVAGMSDDRRAFDLVVGAGGGAQLFAPHIQAKIPDCTFIVLDSCEMGNVRGFFYFGKHMALRQAAA